MKNRSISKYILEDLNDKMVFIGGPRQVGKTTLAKDLIAPHFKKTTYYNWDNRFDRKKIILDELPGSSGLIIYDEIHKYKKWKNYLKGTYDKNSDKYKFLVTGSARLNIFRYGGDSLQGRYHYYHLHPFTLAELCGIMPEIKPFDELNIKSGSNYSILELLFKYGGFPEMVLKQNSRLHRRWLNEKNERLFREDIRDIHLIRDIGNLQLLSSLLPDKVGSLLSINSLREDIEVSHKALSNWLDILENFYYHFRIYPFHIKTIRSLKKEPKLYLYDWSEVTNEGAKFENIIASHLLKFVHFLYYYYGYKTELNYVRSSDKKELDFLITIDKKPWFAVEVKLNKTNIDSQIKYFKEKLKIPYVYQVIKKSNVDSIYDDIRVISADKFLTALI
jgi:uncharacterized protein